MPTAINYLCVIHYPSLIRYTYIGIWERSGSSLISAQIAGRSFIVTMCMNDWYAFISSVHYRPIKLVRVSSTPKESTTARRVGKGWSKVPRFIIMVSRMSKFPRTVSSGKRVNWVVSTSETPIILEASNTVVTKTPSSRGVWIAEQALLCSITRIQSWAMFDRDNKPKLFVAASLCITSSYCHSPIWKGKACARAQSTSLLSIWPALEARK